jgi:sensor histidine kinase YesM
MKKWPFISLHILVWSLLLLTNTIEFYEGHNEYIDKSIIASGLGRGLYAFIFSLGYCLSFLVAFYGFYFFAGPCLFIQKKYIKAAVYSIFVFTLMVITRYLIEFKLLLPYLKFDNYFGNPFNIGYYIENCIGYTFRYCLLGLVAYFLVNANRLEKEKKEIEKEKIQAELSFLRSQINPHFLFNAINDIYALAYQKNDKAPEALLKLSSMLRYMLQEGATDKVELAKEIAYLRDYIELQRIGFKNCLFFDFLLEGDLDDQKITPLLLIPFAENIFKHGVTNDPHSPAQLKIILNNQNLQLFCNNKIGHLYKDSRKGIGLNNVRRRLELLYGNQYTFKVSEKEDIFQCYLQLKL